MKVKCELQDTELSIEHRGECGNELEGGKPNRPSGAFGGKRPTGTPPFGGRPNEHRRPDIGRKPDFESLGIEQICEKSKNCPDKFDTPVCGTDG
ncbi:hypothetical protein, partial [Salmonella sp. s51090]|uniref:hypothetical protein n=1 Tax=Salmonella sp. s51090 TaxID=3159651 RepID=UPI00397F00F9